MEEAKARRIEDEMNDTEFMLNRDTVKKLEADKKLVMPSTLGTPPIPDMSTPRGSSPPLPECCFSFNVS